MQKQSFHGSCIVDRWKQKARKRELSQVAERLGCQSQDGCMKRQQEQKESTLITMLFINYEKNSLENKVI